MLKKHLNGGVKKGALTTDQAEAKFNAWLAEKAAKINNKATGLQTDKEAAAAAALEAEKVVNLARIASNAPVAEVVAEEETEVVAEDAAPEATEEATEKE